MTTNSDYSDEALQKQASQGEEQAFKALFDRYHARLFQYLFNIVKSKEVAEELVMDIFLKMWLARDMIPKIENLDGFLFRAAYNKSIDFFRSAAKDKRFTDIIWEKDQIPSQSYADEPLLMQEYEISPTLIMDWSGTSAKMTGFFGCPKLLINIIKMDAAPSNTLFINVFSRILKF